MGGGFTQELEAYRSRFRRREDESEEVFSQRTWDEFNQQYSAAARKKYDSTKAKVDSILRKRYLFLKEWPPGNKFQEGELLNCLSLASAKTIYYRYDNEEKSCEVGVTSRHHWNADNPWIPKIPLILLKSLLSVHLQTY
jgi:hypothetical protein